MYIHRSTYKSSARTTRIGSPKLLTPRHTWLECMPRRTGLSAELTPPCLEEGSTRSPLGTKTPKTPESSVQQCTKPTLTTTRTCTSTTLGHNKLRAPARREATLLS